MEQNTQQNFNKNSAPSPMPPSKKSPYNMVLIGGIILIVVAIIAGSAFLYWHKNNPTQNYTPTSDQNNNYPTNQGTNNPPKAGTYFVPPAPATSNGYSTPAPNTAVQWNGNPVKIADQKLVLGYQDNYNPGSPNQDNSSYAYYDMGMHGSSKIILAIAPAMDPGGPTLLWFEKTSAGKYIFMSKMSSYGVFGDNSTAGYLLSPIISSADTTTYYNGIVGPTDITYNGLKLNQQYLYPSDLLSNYIAQQKTIGAVSGVVSIDKVGTTDAGDVYF
jgi:hypothetical protein